MNLFIDTNIFLSFYHLTSEDLVELEKLVALIKDQEITLYLTEQVIEETKRNRASKIADSFKTFQKAKSNFAYPAYCKGYPEYNEMRRVQSELDGLHKGMTEKMNADIENKSLKADVLIKNLFSLASVIQRTPKIIELAQTRVLLGNPPGKKGSIGDAINWESLLSTSTKVLYIISDDSDFFSDFNEQNIDDFLDEEWKQKKTYGELFLYRKLSGFFKEHYPDINLTEESEKNALIGNLMSSGSFYTTHKVIESLNKYKFFTQKQLDELFNALLQNNQIRWIAEDEDVNAFYKKLIEMDEFFLLFDEREKEISDLLTPPVSDEEIPF